MPSYTPALSIRDLNGPKGHLKPARLKVPPISIYKDTIFLTKYVHFFNTFIKVDV